MKKILLPIVLSLLTVASVRAQVILQDNFTYSDGLTTNVSGGLWAVHSSSGNNSYIVNNKLEVFGTRGDDINRLFTGTPGTVIYASFVVRMTNLPSASGAYFAHFKDSGNNFRARVFALAPPGIVPNSWRLSIAAATGTPRVFPRDLALNVDYRVVISYDTTGFLGTLWVDPVSSIDQNQFTTDTTAAATLISFAFRQASGEGSILVDDLLVGNSFDDVNVGAVKPATIFYQLEDPVTMFTGNSQNLYCGGDGAGTLTFQWQKEGVDIADGPTYVGTASNILSIVSATLSESGNYRCIVTSTTNGVFSSGATSTVSQVTVSVALVPPNIIQQPTNQTVFFGQSATIYVGANGPGTITYQWKTNGVDILGEISPSLFIPSVQPFNGTTNTYRCAVSNEYGGLLTSPAVLTGVFRPTVSVAFLRTLVDPVTYLATNSTTLYSAVGTVTTFTNLTTANTSSYYLQDSTAGINIFATFGSTFRPAQGDVVFFSGVLSSFNSTLELLASTAIPDTSYFVLSNNLASLPAPKVIPFGITNDVAYCETSLEGRIVMLTNVFFGTNVGRLISTTANTTATVTNAAGETFDVYFSSQDLDTAGQTLPDFAWSVAGPLTQTFNNASNYYSVTITRFADIVTTAPSATSVTQAHTGNKSALTWVADPYKASYTVLTSTNVAGPYSPQDTYQAALFGVNEVPANGSTATGIGTVAVSPDQSAITVNFSFGGLTAPATAGHIHGPAGIGTNNSVLFPFTGVPAATSGAMPEQSFSITPTQLGYLTNGLLYMNVHNTNYPGGEIRGQILLSPSRGLTFPNVNGGYTDINASSSEKYYQIVSP